MKNWKVSKRKEKVLRGLEGVKELESETYEAIP